MVRVTFLELEVRAALLQRRMVAQIHVVDGAVASKGIELPLADQYELRGRQGCLCRALGCKKGVV